MREFTFKLLKIILPFAAVCIVYTACKKIDYKKEIQSEDVATRFFTIPAGTDPLVISVIGNIKRQNENKKFVNNYVRYAGFPIWNKASISTRTSQRSQRTTANTVLYIPFAKDSAEFISAILEVWINGTDTTFNTIYHWQYKDYPATPVGDQHYWDKKDFFNLFADFEYSVFNHTKFRIRDKSILGTTYDSVILTRLQKATTPVQRTASVVAETTCITWGTCIPYLHSRQSRAQGGEECYSYYTQTFCTTYYYEISGGTLPPGGGGGGGGGNPPGGNPDPWANPCRARPEDNPCDGSGGWEPVDVDNEGEDGPCNSTDIYSGATATIQYGYLAPTVAQFAPFDQSGTQPEQYFVVNDVNGVPQIGPVLTTSTIGGPMQGVGTNTYMYVHTHPCCGLTSFSPADFFGLANFSSSFQIAYVVAYDGTKYAMVVNNSPQLQAFVANNPNAIAPDGSFVQGTPIYNRLSAIANGLAVNSGYSYDEAYIRALAFLMKEAGVTLVKAPAGSNTFKKIGDIQKFNADGTPIMQNNLPVFENADCQ